MVLAAAVLVGANTLSTEAQAQDRQRVRPRPAPEKQENQQAKFEEIKQSYQTFDDKDETAIKKQLKFYKENRGIETGLEAWEKSDFYRQWAYVEFRLVANKYGFKIGDDSKKIHPAVWREYLDEREGDLKIIQSALEHLDTAIAHANSTGEEATRRENAAGLLKLQTWKNSIEGFEIRLLNTHIFK